MLRICRAEGRIRTPSESRPGVPLDAGQPSGVVRMCVATEKNADVLVPEAERLHRGTDERDALVETGIEEDVAVTCGDEERAEHGRADEIDAAGHLVRRGWDVPGGVVPGRLSGEPGRGYRDQQGRLDAYAHRRIMTAGRRVGPRGVHCYRDHAPGGPRRPDDRGRTVAGGFARPGSRAVSRVWAPVSDSRRRCGRVQGALQ
jgi:hypothetical protein